MNAFELNIKFDGKALLIVDQNPSYSPPCTIYQENDDEAIRTTLHRIVNSLVDRKGVGEEYAKISLPEDFIGATKDD